MNQCHALADAYYPQAINYYNIQKQHFLHQVIGVANDAKLSLWQNKFLQKFEKAASDISSQDLSETKEFRKELVEEIWSLATKVIQSENSANIKKQIDASRGRTKLGTTSEQKAKYLKNYSDRIRENFNIFIENNASIKEELKAIYTKIYGTNISNTSMSGMISLFRKSMITKVAQNEMHVNDLLSDKNIQGYINLFKGYNAEVIAEKAGNQLLSNLSSSWAAVQVGGSGGVSDVGFAKKGNDLKHIEAILENIEKSSQTFSVETQGATLGPLPAYGLQSKSWVFPEDIGLLKTNARRGFFTVGQRHQLLNQLGLNVQGKSSWWHYNIIAVAIHLIQAIGAANVLYITGGNRYIWTADLISQFREASYYLSFYYRRSKGKFYYPPTSELTWQQEVSDNYVRGKYGNKDNDKK